MLKWVIFVMSSFVVAPCWAGFWFCVAVCETGFWFGVAVCVWGDISFVFVMEIAEKQCFLLSKKTVGLFFPTK